jgi:hypothetical protein
MVAAGLELGNVGWGGPTGPAFGGPDDRLSETHRRPRPPPYPPPQAGEGGVGDGLAVAQPVLQG